MLEPKKVKHRKWHKGRRRAHFKGSRGMTLSFGSFGIQSLGSAWVTPNQIEAARKAITNSLNREGKVWIRVFPDKPVTKFPPEVTMGGGKGEVDTYVVPVTAGRIIFEIDGVPEEAANKALKTAGYKLPFKTRVIVKQ